MFIDKFCLIAMEWNTHKHEYISQSLYSDSNGSMAKITAFGFRCRIVIHINNTIQIISHDLRYFMEFLIIHNTVFINKCRKGNTCQITYSSLVLIRIFHNFRALPCQYSIENSHMSLRFCKAVCIITTIVVFYL